MSELYLNFLILLNYLLSKINYKSFKVRLKLQNFPKNYQSYIISNAFIGIN